MTRAYVFTPARAAALAKARRARKRKSKRLYGSNPVTRGVGKHGFTKNTVPYLRANKRSQTAGFNTGSILPGTGKRLVFGGYVRVENTNRKGAIDKALAKAGNKAMPYGTTRGKVRKYFKENVTITNPTIRANVGRHQARLGSSRGAGPTIILRRGKHKTPLTQTRKGVKKYDTRMRAIAGKKVVRPQRRGK
jgi:hypothetical protein